MIFKEIDFSSENEELLATIEKNCAMAVNARNEIRKAERLLSQQKKENGKKGRIRARRAGPPGPLAGAPGGAVPRGVPARPRGDGARALAAAPRGAAARR